MSNISRRDFLKMAGSGLKGLAIGSGLGAVISGPLKNAIENMGAESISWLLDDDQVRVVKEIEELRSVQVLEGLPLCLQYMRVINAEKVSWDEEQAEETVMNIPEAFRSHGDRVMEIQRILFGDNGRRLVRSISADDSLKSYGRFNGDSRTLEIDIVDDPNSEFFVLSTIHELIHALDPNLIDDPKNGYSKDTLIKVSHGIARVLSQTAKVPGKYLNDSSFYNVALLKKCLGEGLARNWENNGQLWSSVDEATAEDLVDYFKSVKEEEYPDEKRIIFTKKLCHQLGEAILPKILDGTVVIKGSYKKEWYKEVLDGASFDLGVMFEQRFNVVRYYQKLQFGLNSEFLAEMVSDALMYPEKVGENQEIYEGIKEILSAIQGKEVDVREVIDQVRTKSEEVAAKFELETKVKNEALVQERSEENEECSPADLKLVEEPTPDEVQEMVKQIEEEEEKRDVFWDFILEGRLPDYYSDTPEKWRQLMAGYGKAVSALYSSWPEITQGLAYDDLSFDPRMDIWDTWEVALAWKSDDFGEWLQHPELIGENVRLIERRTEVLNRFISSKAFIRDNVGKSG